MKKRIQKRAMYLVHECIRKGEIEKPKKRKCYICLEKVDRLIAHHPDYRRPLDIIWICFACHNKIHRGRFIKRAYDYGFNINDFPTDREINAQIESDFEFLCRRFRNRNSLCGQVMRISNFYTLSEELE